MPVKRKENTSLVRGSYRDLESLDNPTPAPAATPDLLQERAVLFYFLAKTVVSDDSEDNEVDCVCSKCKRPPKVGEELKRYPRRIRQTYLDVASDLGLEQMVDFPTRGDNTLDLTFTSHPSYQERWKPLPHISAKSDHDIVLFDSAHQPVRARPKRRTIYLWKKADNEGIT